MKQFLPVALSLLIVACAPPKPGTVGHQQQLAEEARKNFYALKEQERIARGEAPITQQEEERQKWQRPAKARFKPFGPVRASEDLYVYEVEKPAPKKPSLFATTAKPKPKVKVEPKAKPAPSFWARKSEPKRTDDTVYIFDTPAPVKEPRSNRYLAYKAQYAQALGKRPEDLSRKELEWVRTHYRD